MVALLGAVGEDLSCGLLFRCCEVSGCPDVQFRGSGGAGLSRWGSTVVLT